jgi:hypothetical protein
MHLDFREVWRIQRKTLKFVSEVFEHLLILKVGLFTLRRLPSGNIILRDDVDLNLGSRSAQLEAIERPTTFISLII